MILHEQEPSDGEENIVRAHVNNNDLVGTIHVVEARQVEKMHLSRQLLNCKCCYATKWDQLLVGIFCFTTI
jgi:hypothetical protein